MKCETLTDAFEYITVCHESELMDILLSRNRLINFLADLIPDRKLERNIIANVFSQGITEKLAEGRDKTSGEQQLLMSRYIKILADVGFDENAVKEPLWAYAMALGWEYQEELKSETERLQRQAEGTTKQAEEAEYRPYKAERQVKEIKHLVEETKLLSETISKPHNRNSQVDEDERINSKLIELLLFKQHRLSLTYEERIKEDRAYRIKSCLETISKPIIILVKYILKAFIYIFFAASSVALKGLSFISFFIGGISALGIPYGIYCVYKVITQINENTPLSEATHKWGIYLFIALPFVAFLIRFLADKLSKYIDYQL